MSAIIIIHIKQLISTALKAQMKLLQLQNMRHHLSRVKMKHLTITANQTSIHFDVVTGALPKLIIICLVSDAELVDGYHRN